MSNSKKFALAAAAIFAPALAQAADMPRYPSAPPPPFMEKPYVMQEFISGWYVRADAGWRFQQVKSAEFAGVTLDDPKLDSVAFGGVGAGYKWKFFRMDVTGDYAWRGQFTGSVGPSTPASPTVTAKIDSYTTLLNGYFDLGTWAGFTPYIGAGAGASFLNTTSVNTTPASLGSQPPGHKWNLAYAGMVGVSYRFTYNVMMDVGYRHLWLGDAGGDPQTSLAIKKVTGDEIRVGVRFILD